MNKDGRRDGTRSSSLKTDTLHKISKKDALKINFSNTYVTISYVLAVVKVSDQLAVFFTRIEHAEKRGRREHP